jgi:O-antigen ligase
MTNLRIGPVEGVLLVALAVCLGLAMTGGRPALLLGVVTGCTLLVAAFLSTPLSLYILVFSMLLSPEVVVGGLGAGGTTAGRGLTLRFDDVLLVVFGFVWLVKMAVHKDRPPLLRTPLNGPIMFYTAVSLLATLIGVLEGHVKPLTGFLYNLKYFEYFFLYFMVVNAITSQQQAKTLIVASFVACFLVSLYAIAQIPTGERASAPFEGETGEPNTLGGYLVFMLAICTGLLLIPGAIPRKLPVMILMGTASLALMATLSRASFLAAGVIALGAVVFISHRRPLLLILVLVGVVSFPFWAPDTVKKRILFTFKQAPEAGQIYVGPMRLDTSTSDRLRSWQQSVEWWKRSPLWGHGVTGGPFLDAMYPRVLTEMGLLGIVAFFILTWSLIRTGWTTYQHSQDPATRGLALGFLFGFAGLLVHALGSNTFIIVRIMEPFWLYVALVVRGWVTIPAHRMSELEGRTVRSMDELRGKTAGSPA